MRGAAVWATDDRRAGAPAVTASLSELEQELEGPAAGMAGVETSQPSFSGTRLNKPQALNPKAALLGRAGASSRTVNKMRHDLFTDLQVRSWLAEV